MAQTIQPPDLPAPGARAPMHAITRSRVRARTHWGKEVKHLHAEGKRVDIMAWVETCLTKDAASTAPQSQYPSLPGVEGAQLTRAFYRARNPPEGDMHATGFFNPAAGLRPRPHACRHEHPRKHARTLVSDGRATAWPFGLAPLALRSLCRADIPKKLLYEVKYLRRIMGSKRFKDQILRTFEEGRAKLRSILF